MPDLNPFPPLKPVTGPPPKEIFDLSTVNGGEPDATLKRLDSRLMDNLKGGAKFLDDQVFDEAVIEPVATAAEEFLENKIGKAPLKKFVGGTGLFLIEHTIISHSGRSADPQFVTVVRADGSKYRYADQSFQPRRLGRGEALLDAPAGTLFYVSPLDGSTTVLPAGSPVANEVLRGSFKPENIRPVNAKAIDNEARAEGIRRQLVSERADP